MSEDPPDLRRQADFWNDWNHVRHQETGEVSRRQAEVVSAWLASFDRNDLDILDVGCGSGWLEPSLAPFGRVTATDLADKWIERARADHPGVRFIAGDFASLSLPPESFDVVVSLEVLAHVPDQQAFFDKAASLLRPGGQLLLATQNRPVLEHLNDVPPPEDGQLRRWVDRRELRDLMAKQFEVLELFSVTPRMGRLMQPLHRSRARGPAQRLVTHASGQPRPRTGLGWQLLERAGLGWTLMCRARRR